MVRFIGLTLCLALATLGRAEAGFLIVDNPNPIIARPLTGSITYNVTGSISFDPGFILNGSSVDFAFDANRDSLQPVLVTALGAASNGGVYTGTLFTVTISATTATGVYNTNFAGTAPPAYSVRATGSNNQVQSFSRNYTITVNGAAVPEPSSLALCGVAGALGLGLNRARRRLVAA